MRGGDGTGFPHGLTMVHDLRLDNHAGHVCPNSCKEHGGERIAAWSSPLGSDFLLALSASLFPASAQTL